jgi:hypothetical protein
MNLNMLSDFYVGPKHQEDSQHQKWIFSWAYSIYYSLFIAWTEIKS